MSVYHFPGAVQSRSTECLVAQRDAIRVSLVSRAAQARRLVGLLAGLGWAALGTPYPSEQGPEVGFFLLVSRLALSFWSVKCDRHNPAAPDPLPKKSLAP